VSIFIERYVLPILATLSITILLTAINPLQLGWKVRVGIGLASGLTAFIGAHLVKKLSFAQKKSELSSPPTTIEHKSSRVKVSDSIVVGPVAGRDINIGQLVQGIAPVVEESVYHEKPTATEINETVQNSPFYLQDSVAKSFEGIKVRWQGRINLINVRADDSVSVVLECTEWKAKYLVAYVMTMASLAEYPILKTVRGGEKVEVIGTIADRSGGFIRLRAAKLKFLS